MMRMRTRTRRGGTPGQEIRITSLLARLVSSYLTSMSISVRTDHPSSTILPLDPHLRSLLRTPDLQALDLSMSLLVQLVDKPHVLLAPLLQQPLMLQPPLLALLTVSTLLLNPLHLLSMLLLSPLPSLQLSLLLRHRLMVALLMSSWIPSYQLSPRSSPLLRKLNLRFSRFPQLSLLLHP